jgi:hypothetical protein
LCTYMNGYIYVRKVNLMCVYVYVCVYYLKQILVLMWSVVVNVKNDKEEVYQCAIIMSSCPYHLTFVRSVVWRNVAVLLWAFLLPLQLILTENARIIRWKSDSDKTGVIKGDAGLELMSCNCQVTEYSIIVYKMLWDKLWNVCCNC